jgi:Site-specific DNA methylase
MSKITPFPWYGSKYTQVSWLLDIIPENNRYLEPFGGSGIVLANRDPVEVETFNDIHGGVVNFFEVVRRQPGELKRQLEWTPYSREMYQQAVEHTPEDDVQRAVYFLVRIAQSFGGAEANGWGRSITTSRRGKAQRPAAWEHRLEQIEEVAKRFRRVQLESTDAIGLIEDFDESKLTIYCDPPYPPSARVAKNKYVHEFDADQHRQLAETLRSCEADVVVSGYRCDLLDDCYDGWNCYLEGEKTLAGAETGSREEVCYTNFDG